MANLNIVSTEAAIADYATLTDILYLNDFLKKGTFVHSMTTIPGYSTSSDDDGIVIAGTTTSGGFWIRQFDGDILPEWFGILNDGSGIAQSLLTKWMTACKNFNKPVHFPPGTYCFPVDFKFDFGNFDLTITGVRNKSVITTYDGTAATNFAMPAKIDLTKPKPTDGIYRVDVIANTLHADYSSTVPGAMVDDYIKITGGTPSIVTDFHDVKALGYVTELYVEDGDTGEDGLYVVAKHAFSATGYTGGFPHFNLKNHLDFNTNDADVLYVQGTVLQRVSGKWSRFFSGSLYGPGPDSGNVEKGGGFGTQGSMVIKDIVFNNVRFYLFSPFDVTAASAPSNTSEIFSISGCVFKNCERIISSMIYAGAGVIPKNWFNNVYSTDGRFRFRNFWIIDNSFSYIHQSICWGPPPSQKTIVTGNNVHDCYTILTTFYLFMPTPNNTAYFWLGKISQTVTNNSFIKIRPLNRGANHAACIIRTAGVAVVNDNIFMDITQQAVYFCSTNSTFSNNSVTKFIDDVDVLGETFASSTVVLTKVVDDQGVIEVSGNTIIAPLSSLVEMEGTASFNITGNIFIGCAKFRFLTRATSEISTSRIYLVRHVDTFELLAGANNFEASIGVGNYVYFNKRKNKWSKLLKVLPDTYVFSKSDNSSGKTEHLTIHGNELIESENITRLSSDTNIIFRSISVRNNSFRCCNNFHTGTKVLVEEYICSENYFRDSFIIITTSVLPLTNQIKSLFFENNKIGKSTKHIILFAYQDLVFRNNTLFGDEDYNSANVYTDIGVPTDFAGFVPSESGINLMGTTNSKITVENNQFVNIHTRFNGLLISNPYNLDIKNNSFNLNVPSALISPNFTKRIALKIESSGTSINSILFAGNTIYADATKLNNIIEFGGAFTTISSMTVNNNNVPLINTPTSNISNTMLGAGKTITNYYRGVNFYGTVYVDTIAVLNLAAPST